MWNNIQKATNTMMDMMYMCMCEMMQMFLLVRFVPLGQDFFDS